MDETDLTGEELVEMIHDLFSGEVTQMTEKLDGTNIQATMTSAGEVVFIRNKSDLNSPRGGMSLQDMVDKWKSRPAIQRTFVTAGRTITTIFQRIGSKFFNPTPDTRRVVNCECIIAGTTNIMYYDDDQVDFHNIWIYKKVAGEWVKDSVTRDGLDVLEKAIAAEDKAALTPNVIIQVVKDSNRFAEEYSSRIERLFKEEGLPMDATINDWRLARYRTLAPDWAQGDDDLFNRWFNQDRSVNLRVLKTRHADHLNDLIYMDKKGHKSLCAEVTDPMNMIFLGMANRIILLTKGLANRDNKAKAIGVLGKELEATIASVRASNNPDLISRLATSLDKFRALGSRINNTEGLVFTWRGRMMKLTGSFAILNRIIGLRFELEK